MLDPERCLCGVRVQAGAKAIAIFFLISAISELVRTMYNYDNGREKEPPTNDIISQLILIAVYSMLLYGNSSRRSGFYVPYMILQLIVCVIMIIIMVFYILVAIQVAFTNNPSCRSALKFGGFLPGASDSLGILVGYTAIVMSFTWLCWYLLSIVYRDYKLAKSERATPVPRENREEREKLEV